MTYYHETIQDTQPDTWIVRLYAGPTLCGKVRFMSATDKDAFIAAIEGAGYVQKQ